jgi:anaerobic selenocysteine-containing dehydrogenase
VKALYVYNSNPAVVAPNQNKVLQGLLRDDLFIIVHDQMMTDTARYADMVLPATTCFEHMDLYKSYWHLYLQVADPVIPPIGESKSNVEVFSLLAKAMGFTESCFSDTPEEMIRQALATEHPYVKGITLEELREKGWVRLKTPAAPFVPFADGHFPTSSGKLEFFSRQIQEKEGLDPLPTYVPLAESPDGSPALHRQYPINLINASAKHFVNSSFGNVPSLMQAEKGMDHIEIHIDDAKARQIADGDLVRVFNERGECILRARVGESMPKGSAMTFKSWWNREMLHGNNINRTTSDRSSDIAGGATFYTNLVEVERVPAD